MLESLKLNNMIEGMEGVEKDLNRMTYFVFDTETVPDYSFSPMRTEIIEIGWVLVREGAILEKGDTLIRPSCPIPLKVTEKRGVTNKMAREAPEFKDVFPDLIGKVKGSTLVGHNLGYDIRVVREVAGRKLRQEATSLLLELENIPTLDTQRLFGRLFPDESGRKLKDLLKVLGIQETEQRHRAGADAIYTAQALIKMLFLVSEQHEIKNFDVLEHFLKTGNVLYQRPLF